MKSRFQLSKLLGLGLGILISAVASAGMGTSYNTLPHGYYIERSTAPHRKSGIRRVRMKSSASTGGAIVSRGRGEPPLVQHGVRAVLQDRLHFDFDEAQLKPAGQALLDQFLGRLAGLNPGYGMGRYGYVVRIQLVGHTDSIGSQRYNDRLGQRRAAAVRDYLASRGLNAGAIGIGSRGEQAPIASNRTAAGRAQNRRTDVVLDLVTVPEWRF